MVEVVEKGCDFLSLSKAMVPFLRGPLKFRANYPNTRELMRVYGSVSQLVRRYDAYIAFEGLENIKKTTIIMTMSWHGKFSYGAIREFRSLRSTRR
ncbi:MAG: hypothetical protein HA491_00145 [Candidatus Verstraetearchaeota archaeon]|nr:hypothetical protein [Candidatus Verstraetearchaeota archaeon]